MAASPRDADDRLARWLGALEARHLRDLTFQEVSRSLRALSSCYVERRQRLAAGAALEGAGKRAAFALFYAPLHLLLLRHVAVALELGTAPAEAVVDVGCGTDAAGAALALAGVTAPVLGIDRSAWAVDEARWSWRILGVDGRAIRADVGRIRWPRGRVLAVAAYTVNELPGEARSALLEQVSARIEHGDAVLVLEPLAGAAAPWWRAWASRLGPRARADEWRVALPLPDVVARLDRAAGLNHRVLTARSLFVPPA